MTEAARKRTTVRIDAGIKDGLEKLSKLLHKPQNMLVNEALGEFVLKRTLEVENELVSTLKDLRAYRESDPNFEHAIKAFVEAEASAEHDPAEGRIFSETEETDTTETVMHKVLSE
ncbi:MAG: hypothetical protein IIC06_08380 [Proteobacteria bacterium]|nr:hypothetical protein [Pseudomonadota bacterium]